MSSINPQDQAHFSYLMDEKLDDIPIRSPEDVHITVTALQSLIESDKEHEIHPSLQGRVQELQEVMRDPLSIGDEAFYIPEHLQDYRKIVVERIRAKCEELLHFTPVEIEREAKRVEEVLAKKSAAERTQEFLCTRQPPTGEASTASVPPDESSRQAAEFYARHENMATEFDTFQEKLRRGIYPLGSAEAIDRRLSLKKTFPVLVSRERVPTSRDEDELARLQQRAILSGKLSKAETQELERLALKVAREHVERDKIPDDSFANAEEVINFLHANARHVEFIFRSLDPQGRWRNNKKVALEVIALNDFAYNWLNDSLKGDKNFAIEAIRANKDVFNELSEALQNDPDIRAVYRSVSGQEPPENIFLDFSRPGL